MRLATKFSLIIVVALTVLGSSSLWVFKQVLEPEFQRQREEVWSYRAQQAYFKIEQLLNQTLIISQILKQPVSNLAELRQPLGTLIGTSKIVSIIVADLNRSNVIISLHKGLEHPIPISMDKKEINFLWQKDLFWISRRDLDFEIFIAFNINDIVEMDDQEPVTFYYTLDDGRILGASFPGFNLSPMLQKKIQSSSNAGIVEVDPNNHLKVLVTQVLSNFNLGVGVFGENKIVSATWKSLLSQYIGLILIVISLSLLVGYYFIFLVTKRIELLEEKSLQIGAGNFDIILKDDSLDEVGSLTKTLNNMVGQIKHLFQEQQKQIRIESELKVAQTVQNTLFPASLMQLKDYELAGYYKSASECGGDLWGVWETDRHLNFYILDATGHGVPAALITSAVRAMAAFYETQAHLSVEQISYGFNYAVNKVGNQLHQATSFVCQLEKSSGTIEYVNASHVSGYVIPKGVSEKTKVKEIEFLIDPVSNRLGESDAIEIKKGTYQIQQGEILLLVTDGLFDLSTQDGKGLRENRAIKKFIEFAAKEPNGRVHDILFSFVDYALTENGKLELKDDVTLIALKRV
jgi:serine phosphatase RsbU (regulator of sigma subunit)